MMDDTSDALLRQIHRELGVIGTKVDGLKESVDQTTKRHERRLNAHSDKLGSLEQSRSRLRGMLAVFGVGAAGAGGAATAFFDNIKNFFSGQ